MREAITVARRDLMPKPAHRLIRLVDALNDNSQHLGREAQSTVRVNHRATRAMFIEDHDQRPLPEMNLRDSFSESDLTDKEYERMSDILSEVAWRLKFAVVIRQQELLA